jgi:methyl-accepting chemotaxis protein
MNPQSALANALANMPLKRKFLSQTFLVAIGIVALAIIAARMQYLDLVHTRQAGLKAQTQMAVGVVESYAERAAKGELSLDEAQRQALATLATLQANKGVDYFYVTDEKPTMLMHPTRPDLVGKPLNDVLSPDGQRIFPAFVKVAQAGGGYVDYKWAKPGQKDPVAKSSYNTLYKPWGWVIGTGVYFDDTQSQALVFTGIMTLAGGVLVLVNLGLGWLLGNAVLVPVGRALAVIKGVSHGDLHVHVGHRGRDEIGQMLQAMDEMQGRLRHVIEAQNEMGRQHEAGTVSYRIPSQEFAGEFATMVEGTNRLVADHIQVKMRVVELAQAYAAGDLSQEMEALPGEKAVITSAINGVRGSLQAINNEIKHLAQAAAAGDFSVRGDASAFRFDFAAMIGDLNSMMAVNDRNLGKLSTLLRAIADGDLTARMHGEFHGVFARMRDDANATVEQLTGIVGRIQEASGSINLAAGEIAEGNNDLSRRTEQQAANLEETAASMEELTSTVKQNAEHARQANQLAIGAASVASQGGVVVGEVVHTMSGIETSSRKIAEIISVIDGIAFQTNILALNAAVEAARAGEQGRGFAVVASEVRTLAQRSANAAKEIKHLIDDSVDKVSEGSALVRKAGETMHDIVTSVQRVTDIMAEITAASQEQSAGIEQVNQTITQMDETTQQNAALVEEATASARALEEQAGELREAVAQFRLAQADVAAGRLVRRLGREAAEPLETA